MIYIVETQNQTVVRNNYDIIEEASKRVEEITILSDKNYLKTKYKNNSLIITGSLTHAFRLFFFKRQKKVAVWVQGILPEESYLRRKSKLRFKLLSFMEKLALKKASFLMFVSNEMKSHYERKYNLSFSNYLVFPCFNTGINLTCFEEKEKYNNNVFVYAGGTAKWQNLDAIVKAYSLIENKLPNTKFLFLVNDSAYANELILKHNVKNYEIKYVSKGELPKELAKVKYGFVLREDNKINQVSTPTKLSTYLSCGIIPIFTDCIRDFYNLMLNKTYKIVFYEKTFENNLKQFLKVDKNQIKKEYLEIFEQYYSGRKYLNLISDFITINK